MDIRRTLGRVVHGADAHKAHGRARPRIVAPDRDLADRATRDALSLAARRWCHDDLRLGGDMLDPLGLIHRIERVYGACFALAPAAVAGRHDHRLGVQTIGDMAARASTLHRLLPSASLPPYTRTKTPPP